MSQTLTSLPEDRSGFPQSHVVDDDVQSTQTIRSSFDDAESIYDDDSDDDEDFRPKKKKKAKRSSKKQQQPPESDSDSVVVIGTLAEEMKGKQPPSQPTSFRQSTLKLSKRNTTLLSKNEQEKKRIPPNQLFSAPSNATATNSVPRRGGTAVAETRVRTARTTTKWTNVREMCEKMQLDGNFTAVDIGRVNMGIIQLSCSGPKITLKDWMLINLDTLAEEFETKDPQRKFADKTGVCSNDSHCHILTKWVSEQAKNGGIFDSSVVLIESQSFSREMKALEKAVHCGVVLSKPDIMVRLNNPEFGPVGIRQANFVSPAVIVSANSVKTCYAPFFPRVTETQATLRANNPGKKFKAFGLGDANRDSGDGFYTSKQYKENKKNSVLYGEKLIPVNRIIELLPSMSAKQRERFRVSKKDDIYDAMWIALYGIESWLHVLYSRRERGYGADNQMYGALEQRRYRTCDALFEFAESVGTPPETIAELQTILTKFRESAIANGEEEEGDEEL